MFSGAQDNSSMSPTRGSSTILISVVVALAVAVIPALVVMYKSKGITIRFRVGEQKHAVHREYKIAHTSGRG